MQSLREMQLLAEAEFSIEDSRTDMGRIVEFFESLPYHENALVAISDARHIPIQTLRDQHTFFVDEGTKVIDIPEDLRAESLGFVSRSHVVYDGRVVFPVYDVKKQVMGFCGWDKFEQPKYLDSKNHGYKAKENTFFGMERLEEYYRSGKPIYVVEGIFCCLYLRSVGLQAVASLGSSLTKYVVEIFRRVQNRVVFIPDNDVIGKSAEEINTGNPAGEHYVKQVKKQLPRATIVQSTLAKDVDDTRLADNGKYADEFIKELIAVANCPFYQFKTIRVR